MTVLSAHQRIALFRRFAPVENTVSKAAPAASRGSGFSSEKLHEDQLYFRGRLGADRVEVCIHTGGIYAHPLIVGRSMEPPGVAGITPDDIIAAVREVLGSM